jgi:hypothetical protein
VLTLLTFCPPGPLLREVLKTSSDSEISFIALYRRHCLLIPGHQESQSKYYCMLTTQIVKKNLCWFLGWPMYTPLPSVKKIDGVCAQMLYCKNLRQFGSVAQLVEQRPFKPNSAFLSRFKKGSYNPKSTVSEAERRLTEDQPKVRSACLARTWRALRFFSWQDRSKSVRGNQTISKNTEGSRPSLSDQTRRAIVEVSGTQLRS